ncbi:hypothetical protein [Bradyrhizobium sp. RDM4]|uniref:hypothetical protein n=1 Tax=Bradyrhizobium sp. RDM4 TaxID=3378765 RepID=UPI0038FC7D0D
MMMTRSRPEMVKFEHPFRIASFKRILAAGSLAGILLMTPARNAAELNVDQTQPEATIDLKT